MITTGDPCQIDPVSQHSARPCPIIVIGQQQSFRHQLSHRDIHPVTPPQFPLSRLLSILALNMTDTSDLHTVLAGIDLDSYESHLVENGFDTWETVTEITETDMIKLGFKLGDSLHHDGSHSVVANA